MKNEGSFGDFRVETQPDFEEDPELKAARLRTVAADEALRQVMTPDAVEHFQQGFEGRMQEFDRRVVQMHEELRKQWVSH